MRVESATCDRQGAPVDVGRENPDPWRVLEPVHDLAEQDGDGIGLLSGRAGRDPNAHGVGRGAVLEEGHEGFLGERGERLGVAEEGRDADQQFAHEHIGFPRLACEVPDVVIGRFEPQHVHAPLDAAHQRRRAVMLEIDVGPLAQESANRHELFLDSPPPEPRPPACFGLGPEPQIVEHRMGDAVEGKQVIGEAQSGNAVGKRPVGVRLRRLQHGHSARGADRLEPDETVRSFGAKQDADHARTEVASERAKGCIDGSPALGGIMRGAQPNPPLPHLHHHMRRGHVKMAGQHRPAVDHRRDGEFREARKLFRAQLAIVRACALGDDDRQPRLARKCRQKGG